MHSLVAAAPALKASRHRRRRLADRWLAGCDVGRDVQVRGPVLVRGTGPIVIGDGAVLDAARVPIELHAWRSGRLVIGAGARIGPGCSIEAAELVEIGPGARLEPFAKVMDNSWHRTGGNRASIPESAQVRIGARAHVGARSIVLPGAVLGDGATLPDDAVLTRSGATIRPSRTQARSTLPRAGAERHGQLPDLFPEVAEPAIPADLPTIMALTALTRLQQLGSPSQGEALAARAERWGGRMLAAWVLRGVQQHDRALATGQVSLRNEGTIRMHPGSGFAGGPMLSRVVVAPGARLTLGARSVFNYGSYLRAEEEISFGADCMVGSRSLLVDQLGDRRGPIRIGDRVWLSHGVTVLPGVSIGSGSAVAAGTVVDADLPAGSLALGSPMRVVPLPDDPAQSTGIS